MHIVPELDTEILKVNVSKSLLLRFRELVSAKHPYRRGALRYEVEQALAQYIATYRQTHNTKNLMQAENSNPTSKIYQLKQEVYKYLVDCGMYDQVPQFIPDKHLTTAIGYIKGTDKRTIKKWTKALREYGCIKISGPHQYEFV